MNVTVQLFAAARDAMGQDQVQLQLPPGATVGSVRTALAERAPALQPVLQQAVFAVGTEYVVDSEPLAEGSRIACIPPVSGG